MLLEGKGAWLGDGGEGASTWGVGCDFGPASCLPFTPGPSLTLSGRAKPRPLGWAEPVRGRERPSLGAGLCRCRVWLLLQVSLFSNGPGSRPHYRQGDRSSEMLSNSAGQ